MCPVKWNSRKQTGVPQTESTPTNSKADCIENRRILKIAFCIYAGSEHTHAYYRNRYIAYIPQGVWKMGSAGSTERVEITGAVVMVAEDG
jgi:hypothetical protein